jgi:hypothetical protein
MDSRWGAVPFTSAGPPRGPCCGADPSGSNRLNGDGDEITCERKRAPYDREPVPRP